MGRRRRPRKPGRPTLLNPEVERRLVDAVRLGAPVAVASAHAGISEQSFYNWMNAGREEIEARDAGEPPNPDHEPHMRLWERIIDARAAATIRNVGQLQKAAAGGYVTEETTRKFRDPETGRIITETTTKRAPVDWRAAAWWLERQQRSHFGKGVDQVELTGANGGPLQVEATVDVQALTQRLQAHLATAQPVGELSSGRAD
ncbi:hypothetical protein ABN028_19790 [Actinopolymorpha sp. B17G11]|uniref:hypothetical protein n=1 Tax=Actinopolymorpha sp. B17G11 TaxID=3160861 RepID=UPI0032E51BE5